MSNRDNINPSDLYNQEAKLVVGTVINTKGDPDKTGKIQVRTDDTPQEAVSDEKLPWLNVVSDSQPTRGIGLNPVGPTNYNVGSRCLILIVSQQEQFVLGMLPNSENSDNIRDVKDATRKTKVVIDGKPAFPSDEFKETQATGTKHARCITNQKCQTPSDEGDPLKSVQDGGKTPDYLGGIIGTIFKKVKVPHTIGSFKHFKGDKSLINATKFAKDLLGEKGNLIKNGFDILESMKANGKKGLNIPAFSFMGGTNLINNALSDIASMIQANSPSEKSKEQKEELDVLEELLRALYKEISGLEATHPNGDETQEYVQWKAQYLKALREEAANV